MKITPEDLARQAGYEAQRYMSRGMAAIAEEFDVEYLSNKHIELCKALLPAYMAAATEDFKGVCIYQISEELSELREAISFPLFGSK